MPKKSIKMLLKILCITVVWTLFWRRSNLVTLVQFMDLVDNNIVVYNSERKYKPKGWHFWGFGLIICEKKPMDCNPVGDQDYPCPLKTKAIPCKSFPVLHPWNVVKCNAIKWEYVWCLFNFMWIIKQWNCEHTFE